MFWLYFILFILLIVFIVAIVTLVILLKTKVPFVSLPIKTINKILDLISLEENEILYELGCGDSRFLIAAQRKYKIKGVGYELNWWALIRSKLNIFFHQAEIVVYNKDFLKEDLSKADYIFVYLLDSALLKLEKKIIKNNYSEVKIISYGFKFPNLTPSQVLSTQDRTNNNKGLVYIYNL